MLPAFLVPEQKVRQDGKSEPFAIPSGSRAMLFITLGITHTLEQESLDVTLHGSADGLTWTAKPLLAFPQKFYCGTYKMVLDLAKHADINHLRVSWHLNRWGRGDLRPLFGFYVFAEQTAHGMRAEGTSAG